MKTKVMQRPRKNSSEIEVLSRNVGVRGRRDRIFDGMIYVILFLVAFSILFPMLFVISASLTPYTEVMRNGGFLVIPRVISLMHMKRCFKSRPYRDRSRSALLLQSSARYSMFSLRR